MDEENYDSIMNGDALDELNDDNMISFMDSMNNTEGEYSGAGDPENPNIELENLVEQSTDSLISQLEELSGERLSANPEDDYIVEGADRDDVEVKEAFKIEAEQKQL